MKQALLGLAMLHCGGMAITKPIREWHALAAPEPPWELREIILGILHEKNGLGGSYADNSQCVKFANDVLAALEGRKG